MMFAPFILHLSLAGVFLGGIPGPQRLERTPGKTYRYVFHQHVDSFCGSIAFPVPPSDPNQDIKECSMTVKIDGVVNRAKSVPCLSPTEQTAMVAEIPSTSSVDLDVVVTWRHYETKIVQGQGESSTKNPNSKASLHQAWETDEQRQWFSSVLSENGLLKSPEESDVTFTSRLEQFMKDGFRYKIPSDWPPQWFEQYKAAFRDRIGECWKLTDIFAQTLRLNKIPVRQVSGNNLDGSHHLRCLVWLTDLGWTPVEVTQAVYSKDLRGTFGSWTGVMLDGNWTIDLRVPTDSGTINIGTFDRPFWLSKDGRTWFTDDLKTFTVG